jgi:uncharacterized protein YggU (UPF0235/DUF167 family)
MLQVVKITLFYKHFIKIYFPQEKVILVHLYITVNSMHLIRVKAFPDAKKQSIQEIEPHKLRIFVREPAQNNQANKKIIALLADFYGITPQKIRMIAGHQGQNKTFQVYE